MVYSDKYKYNSDIDILLFSTHEEDSFLKDLLEYIKQALSFYLSFYGFYPYKYLAVVEGEDDCGGGYPQNEGVICIHKEVLTKNKVKESWQWIIAHEIGHLYYGYYVLDKNPRIGSKLGWFTKGLGLYVDKHYLVKKGIDYDCHDRMIDKYKRYQEKYPDLLSFNLAEEKRETLNFDYNDVIDHCKSLYVIDTEAKLLGESLFLELCKSFLLEKAGKKVDFKMFKDFVFQKTMKELIFNENIG